MTETPDLPTTLNRRCCSGKSCTTTLYLHTMKPEAGAGEDGIPTLYRYLRGNDNDFGPGWSTRARLAAWVEESAAADEAEDERIRQAEDEESAWRAGQDKR